MLLAAGTIPVCNYYTYLLLSVLNVLYVASLRASAHRPLWAVRHLGSSPNLPDILRINHADGPPRVVIAELFQGVEECSALQTQGASDRCVVPNPCYTTVS